MQTVLWIIHFVACLSLIGIVLLQSGRGAELGAAFGGASQTLFGSSGGSTFMGKLTTLAAVGFMITCLSLTYFSTTPSTESIMEGVEKQAPQGPAVPEAKPVQPQVPEASKVPSGEESAARSGAAAPVEEAPTESSSRPSQAGQGASGSGSGAGEPTGTEAAPETSPGAASTEN